MYDYEVKVIGKKNGRSGETRLNVRADSRNEACTKATKQALDSGLYDEISYVK